MLTISEAQCPLLARSVKSLLVFNNEYDPSYCPAVGKLAASYNGSFITVSVEGIDVAVQAVMLEGIYNFTLELECPGTTSWAAIFRGALQIVCTHMYTIAINQLNWIRLHREEMQRSLEAGGSKLEYENVYIH